WLLYLAWPQPVAREPTPSGSVMRVPVAGGPAQQVLSVSGYPGSARVKAEGRARPAARGYPSFRCPVIRATYCVVGEEAQNQVVFSRFDPVQGEKAELFRFDIDPSTVSFWDLSPDGSQIAFLEREERRGLVRIRPVSGETARDLLLAGRNHLDSVA